MEKPIKLNEKTEAIISKLNYFECSPAIITKVRTDLNWEANRARFMQTCNEKNLAGVLDVLEIATDAHKTQTYKRNKDATGLSNVPYINHPIEMANLAIDLDSNPNIISGCLLHDVIEDTKIKITDLKLANISEEIIGIVNNVTKHNRETRTEYFNRVFEGNSLDSKIVKLIDRYHNLIRAFTLSDLGYLERVIIETRAYFLPQFESIPLPSIERETLTLIDELEKYRLKLQANLTSK
jgi:(p)ppGpp synthase/HD superfamily hydrolase